MSFQIKFYLSVTVEADCPKVSTIVTMTWLTVMKYGIGYFPSCVDVFLPLSPTKLYRI